MVLPKTVARNLEVHYSLERLYILQDYNFPLLEAQTYIHVHKASSMRTSFVKVKIRLDCIRLD